MEKVTESDGQKKRVKRDQSFFRDLTSTPICIVKMKRKSADDYDGGGGDGGCCCDQNVIIDVSGSDLSCFGCSDNDHQESSAVISSFFYQHTKINNSTADGTIRETPTTITITSLDISRCRLGPNGLSHLLSYLSSSHIAVQQMNLQRNGIGSTGGKSLGTFLQSNYQYCTYIDLSLNDIKAGESSGGGSNSSSDDRSATESISYGLAHNTSVTTLIMNKCALGPDGAAHLAYAIRHNTTLQVLHLEGNMIGPHGAKKLFDALQCNSSLKEINLRMNRIGGGGGGNEVENKADVRSLTCALLGKCQLIKLDLSYNDLRCLGCTILSEALQEDNHHSSCCSLRELILEKNDIDHEGAVALANSLATTTAVTSSSDNSNHLHTLVLRGNAIGDVGAVAIGKMLEHNRSLKVLDVSSCSIGNEGGAAIGSGLSRNSNLETLNLDKNNVGSGKDYSLFSEGVTHNNTLKSLHLSANGMADNNDQSDISLVCGDVVAKALSNNKSLQYLDLSNNDLLEVSIVDAIASHPSVTNVNLSDNGFECISIETQLKLAERMTGTSSSIEVDLSFNALSSPPLGRLADSSNLKSYLRLLAKEKTAVTRIRLMVCGHGGVGKSTFARAVTSEKSNQSGFQASLLSVNEWGTDRLIEWANRLGTPWSGDAARLISDECITGKDLLAKYVTTGSCDNIQPTDELLNLCSSKYQAIESKSFARAISSLCAKGYLSTVGVVKIEGTVPIGDNRTCSLVDFAGQQEFLISHQLLLSSLHTLCLIIQPAPSFESVEHRHHGSWQYWKRFLSSLGDRRRGSLLVGVSQLDKVLTRADNFISREFDKIKTQASGAITCNEPLRLDYSPEAIADTIYRVKQALTKSTSEVATSWWVPKSYETLSNIVSDVAKAKSANHELPMLTLNELIQECNKFCERYPESSALMTKMSTDSQLLQKAIEYLEAVGDIMQAGDQILIDPIGWFSSFLSHFIKDDLAVTTIQIDNSDLRRQRGVVLLGDIIEALAHEYVSPHEHITQIMELLCGLELCVPLCKTENSFLFPCLLPSLSNTEILGEGLLNCSTLSAIRGHRFRESSGFIPPGLFLGIIARLFQRLAPGTMQPAMMWRDHAILCANNKGTTRVLLRCNLTESIIDVVAFAPSREQLFVGAAKGQASIVTWIVHLIKMFLQSYSQLKFDEFWMCTNSFCHGINEGRYSYQGTEFPLSPRSTRKRKAHDCNTEGCWRFLGVGHSVNTMQLSGSGPGSTLCEACGTSQVFTLRDKLDG